MTARRVRVVKAGGPKFWYAKRIGEVFEVTGAVRLKENAGFPGYWVINPSEPERIEHYVIDIDDCVPVTEAVSNVPPCYDGGACRNADAVCALQATLKQLADELETEPEHDKLIMALRTLQSAWACAEDGFSYEASQVKKLQARLKLADDLVREFVHRSSPMTPQQREAWEKWTGKGAG